MSFSIIIEINVLEPNLINSSRSLSFQAPPEKYLDDEIWFKDPLHDDIDLNPISAALIFKVGRSANQFNFCFDTEEVGA